MDGNCADIKLVLVLTGRADLKHPEIMGHYH